MVVELLHYHRKESRFSSVEALQTQLFKDIEFGKQFVAKIRQDTREAEFDGVMTSIEKMQNHIKLLENNKNLPMSFRIT